MLKKKLRLAFALLSLLCVSTSYVYANDNTQLDVQRIAAINKYVRLLGQGNYPSIVHLFSKNAVAVSSSGEADSIPSFYKKLFTQIVRNPRAKLINIFSGQLDKNMLTAYFNYSWNNSKGDRVSAKFLDLFIFEKNTQKIKTIFIFGNTFKTDTIMKQLDG